MFTAPQNEPFDVIDVWARTVQALREHYQLTARQLSHVRLAKPVTFMGNNMLVAVPHESARTFLETNIREELSAALSEVFGYDVGFGVHIDPLLDDNLDGSVLDDFQDDHDPADTATPLLPQIMRPVDPPSLNTSYTFKTFVTGSSNRMAHATSFAVAEAPVNAYNPLFIYGRSGLGKTHLLHAIGHYAYKLNPQLRIKYLNAEAFFTDYINSILNSRLSQDEGMSAFRRRYRDIDILLIDDIQFLGRKEKGLEEFFHTFETLHGSRKQIVITSDLPPKQLPGFAERFTSRFSWGMTANIEAPELETRIAILRLKREAQNLDIDDEVLNYIATKITTNIRELEGALLRVTAFASFSEQPITMELAEEQLKDIVSNDDLVEVSAEDIMEVTAKFYGLTVDDLRHKSRLGSLVEARSIAMYLCRQLTDLSFPEIGRLFNRDHSTVMTSCKKVTGHMATHVSTYNQVTELAGRIKGHGVVA